MSAWKYSHSALLWDAADSPTNSMQTLPGNGPRLKRYAKRARGEGPRQHKAVRLKSATSFERQGNSLLGSVVSQADVGTLCLQHSACASSDCGDYRNHDNTCGVPACLDFREINLLVKTTYLERHDDANGSIVY